MGNISVNAHIYKDEKIVHQILEKTDSLVLNIGEVTIFYNDLQEIQKTIEELKILEAYHIAREEKRNEGISSEESGTVVEKSV